MLQPLPPLQNNDNLLSIMYNRLITSLHHLNFNLLSGPLEMGLGYRSVPLSYRKGH